MSFCVKITEAGERLLFCLSNDILQQFEDKRCQKRKSVRATGI